MPTCPDGMETTDLLYSESNSRILVSVRPENRAAFEAHFAGRHFALIGEVGGDALALAKGGQPILTENVEALTCAWKAPFGTEGPGLDGEECAA